MVVIICGKYGNNRSRTENITERTRFSKSRSNDLEDIGQGQRSSHATHLLILVIICIKYGKNPSRTVDATERTRFSKSRLNDLEYIGQGQRSSHATHLLMLVIICIKYGKNPSRTVDAQSGHDFQGQAKWPWRYRSRSKVIICNTPSHTSDHLYQIWKESIENCRFFFKVKAEKFQKFAKNFQILKKRNMRHTP